MNESFRIQFEISGTVGRALKSKGWRRELFYILE